MKLLTINEVATKYSLKISFIRRQVFIRKIPFVKIGSLVRFNSNEIENWVSQKRKGVLNETL